MILVSIFDKKAEIFGPPNAFLSLGECERANLNYMLVGKGEFVEFPEDYSLFKIGELDQKTGAIAPCSPPEFLFGGLDLQMKARVLAGQRLRRAELVQSQVEAVAQ